jgi:menaquinone-dependent protoporphyrinogen oxidase
MNILIVYDTKYGFTEKCSETLRNRLEGNVDSINLRNKDMTDLSKYEMIIIGGPIYGGRISKRVRLFCSNNKKVLANKRIGLFVSCSIAGDEAVKQLENAFPKELYNIAIAKECFGGEINIDKAKFFDKLIIKMVSKSDNNSMRNDGILFDNIEKFANNLNNYCKS